jgi:hypothetical protein
VVDQHRETSIVSVRTNGGNIERFRISVPMDRIMIGAPGNASPVPADLYWPDDPRLQSASTELFKLRNERDAVVGVAGRLAARGPGGEPVIEWVLHLPARGSAYIAMSSQPGANGIRTGRLRGGTREFSARVGGMAERFVPVSGDSGPDGARGRIELDTAFVGTEADLE